LTSNRNVLVTRRGNTLYVHLHRDPVDDGVKLKPLAAAPRRPTLLNTGQDADFAVDLVPSEHAQRLPCRKLCNLPVNELANTALMVKLEFEDLPE
jgi:alpha-L-fucosidase